MSARTLLSCPACGGSALADDEFCEACGAAIAGPRDAPRHHFEVDLGWVAAVSDRGLVHRRNEDAVHVEARGRSASLVVCDGVSTSAAPQVAAQVAAEVAGRAMSSALALDAEGSGSRPGGTVADALGEAARAVAGVPWLSVAERDAPSCTIVVALWDGLDITVAWVGDSRAYWLDAAGARRLTSDHSWAEEQVRAGRLSRAAAEADGRAHAITRWLGADAPSQDFPVQTMRPARAGHLILCTDGLWNYLPSAGDLERAMTTGPGDGSPVAAARALVRHALGHGGHDNVTVAVAAIDPGARAAAGAPAAPPTRNGPEGP